VAPCRPGWIPGVTAADLRSRSKSYVARTRAYERIPARTNGHQRTVKTFPRKSSRRSQIAAIGSATLRGHIDRGDELEAHPRSGQLQMGRVVRSCSTQSRNRPDGMDHLLSLTTSHSVLLPAPAPAHRLRRPRPCPTEICDRQSTVRRRGHLSPGVPHSPLFPIRRPVRPDLSWRERSRFGAQRWHPGRPPGGRPTPFWSMTVRLRRGSQGSAPPAFSRP